jgi:uncharacterized membrane protein YjgN (DUF898 family)
MFTIIGADGKEYGPVTADQIKQWITEHRLTLGMKARRAGETEWRLLGDFSEFALPVVTPASIGGPPPSIPGPRPAEPAAASPLAATNGQPESIVFTGEWTEYFKMWIVNVLLTVVTLGIYAAWAKVRRRRYFYANTRLFGHTFEYLADPLKIFYGNLIVAAVFVLNALLGALSPLLQLPFIIFFVIAVPWFVVRALAFNARNTAWRGLRFNFTGTYGGSAIVFLLWPLLVPVTLGLLFPYVAKLQKQFVIEHHAYGTSPFSFSGTPAGFYRIYGIATLFFLPIVFIYFVFIAMMIAAAAKQGSQVPMQGSAELMGSMGVLFLVGLPLAIAGIFYFRSRMFNYLWNNTTLAGNTFSASMRARDLFGIHFVNSIVTLITLGLLHPWAAVRMYKYQMDSLKVIPAGNVDAFVAAAQPPVSAVGEAANDFFDFDLGFGV